MEKKWFVGIDVSKKTIDVVYYDRKRQKVCEEIHMQFPNEQSGFKLMRKWFKECDIRSKELVIGLENTGIYSFDLLKNDTNLKKNYDLLLSVKCVGSVNAIAMIIHTNNFESFENARKYVCYVGVAPFCNTSGTSIKRKQHVCL